MLRVCTSLNYTTSISILSHVRVTEYQFVQNDTLPFVNGNGHLKGTMLFACRQFWSQIKY